MGIRKVMVEVAKKPLVFRKSGVSSLLWYVMRGTSSKLHSRAEQLLRLLVDNSILNAGDKFGQGKLCEELEAVELTLMWDSLYEELSEAVSNGSLLHLNHLLSLLISTVQIDYVRKITGG
ncbi:unnamed protein product, partial [Thlaspi arvense]